jgi:DNA-binding response OmpR family regulator
MFENRKALILIVEDDKRLSHANCYALESEGYEVRAAFTLAEARGLLNDISPDVILLDVKLPDGSGFDLCREIRETTGAYIIFLTSVRESSGELEGLVAGGDDYLKKPYGIELLYERIKKGLRHERKTPQLIKRGSLTLDILVSRAYMDGKDLVLTQKEFLLLYTLAQNEGQNMSAEELYDKVWKSPLNDDNQAVKIAISRLRNKIEGSGFTVSFDKRKNGYSFGVKRAG